MPLFPIIFALWNIWVYISPTKYGNKASNMKHLLIKSFILVSLFISQMSSQMMAMSDLDNILITLGQDAIEMLLKIWLFFKIISTTSEVKGVVMFSMK